MRLAASALLFAALALTGSGPLSADDALEITVSPTQAFAPATVRVVVRMTPRPENRELELVADSTDFYRSSCISLEGERAPRMLSTQFDGLPAGEYELRGVVTDTAGSVRAIARQTVNVVAPASSGW